MNNKNQTHNIESVNSNLRKYIPCLQRKSKCFSRSLELLKVIFTVFVHVYNKFSSIKSLFNKLYIKNIKRHSFIVLFTFFGYQICSNALMKYCGNNVKMLKNAFFYSSIIPMIIYISWTFVVLSVIYNNDINFYNIIINGKVDVGNLINKLSNILPLSHLNLIIWMISILAIFTSIIGVGLSLKDSYINIFKEKKI